MAAPFWEWMIRSRDEPEPGGGKILAELGLMMRGACGSTPRRHGLQGQCGHRITDRNWLQFTMRPLDSQWIGSTGGTSS